MPFDIFLSYHWKDQEFAQQVYDGLTGAGFQVWFDRECIKPGDSWMAAIEQGLSKVHTFVVLLTDSAPKRWVEAEVGAAIRRFYAEPDAVRIVPVIIGQGTAAPESLGAFLDAFQRNSLAVADRRVVPDGLDRLIDGLRRLNAPDGKTPVVVDEPFRGLEPYRIEDQHLFFGRVRETSELVGRLQTGSRWLQVEGASGSGKSSLVRAGLAPAPVRRLRDRDDTDWVFLTMRPGTNPVRELAVAVLGLDPDNTELGRLDATERVLCSGPSALANLLREWNRVPTLTGPGPCCLSLTSLRNCSRSRRRRWHRLKRRQRVTTPESTSSLYFLAFSLMRMARPGS